MTTVDGLPAHVLLVHAVVVLVPMSALLLVLVAVWPAARRRLAVPTAALAMLTAVVVPLTTKSGEWLEHRVDTSPLLRAHTQLGDTMTPWVIGLALVAVGLAARELRTRRRSAPGTERGPGTARTAIAPRPRGSAHRVLPAVVALVAVVVAVGSIITVYRIGDSGARAVWTGQFTEQPIQLLQR